MDGCAASASQGSHGRFTLAKLQTATNNYVNNVLCPVQVSVEVVERAMDRTEMIIWQNVKNDRQQW